jgi:hypothetical protein
MCSEFTHVLHEAMGRWAGGWPMASGSPALLVCCYLVAILTDQLTGAEEFYKVFLSPTIVYLVHHALSSHL